jgi:hypothetical protein
MGTSKRVGRGGLGIYDMSFKRDVKECKGGSRTSADFNKYVGYDDQKNCTYRRQAFLGREALEFRSN